MTLHIIGQHHSLHCCWLEKKPEKACVSVSLHNQTGIQMHEERLIYFSAHLTVKCLTENELNYYLRWSPPWILFWLLKNCHIQRSVSSILTHHEFDHRALFHSAQLQVWWHWECGVSRRQWVDPKPGAEQLHPHLSSGEQDWRGSLYLQVNVSQE